MRLRNIPRAEGVLETHSTVIKDKENCRGHWADVFENQNPLYIEIGMGKGQFLLELARRNLDINYIGIERYSSVLLRATEKYDMLETPLPNIRFICMDATEIEKVFAPGEVSGIYLNFSDPWPKKRHARRRLTSKEFFARYDKILAPEGRVEFKTDNHDLFAFSLEQVEEAGWKLLYHTWDLHHDEILNQGNVMTEYEAKFSAQGNPIHKLAAGRIH